MTDIPPRPKVGSEEKWVFYCDREEWSDVQPIRQDDGENPVVRIAYTDQFSDIYDYLRGVMANREKSQRVLLLTEDAIEMNAANYTVWHYRRLVLKEIGSDLRDELSFCREMIEENPKNYQVWHHRRVVVEWLQDPSQERRLTEVIFAQDAKNYHAWEHRQWVLQTFRSFDGELDYTCQLLASDSRNNSAWNHRYFVLSHTGALADVAVLAKELEYARSKIELIPANESPWNFLKGLLKKAEVDVAELASDVTQWIWDLVRATQHPPPPTATDGLALISSLQAGQVHTQVLVGLLDMLMLYGGAEERVPHKLAELLVEQDGIRERYWKHLKATLDQA